MWVQQLNKIGLISLNKLYAGECGRFADKTRSKSSTRQAGRNDGSHTFLDEETQKFQVNKTNQNYWDQKLAATKRQPVFDDGENESLEDELKASWTIHLISRQPF